MKIIVKGMIVFMVIPLTFLTPASTREGSVIVGRATE